jgi:hypothetical protein
MRTPCHLRNPVFPLLLSSLLAAVGADAPQGRPSRYPPRSPSEVPSARRPWVGRLQPSEHILSAQFEATVYELQVPADRLASLDEKALTAQAATPEKLLSALTQTGKTRVLYRLAQPVNVFSTTSMIGASEPVVTGSRAASGTNAVNRISYQSVGFIVRLSAQPATKDDSNAPPKVKMAVQLSALYPGEKETAPGQKETVTRSVSLDHSEVLAMNSPRALLAISTNVFSRLQASAKGGGKAETPVTPVAYVITYQFTPATEVGGPGGSAARGVSNALRDTTETTNSLPARLQATIYEVEPATNALPPLNLQALARAGAPELLFEQLGSAGKARVLYRIDQPVDVFSDQVLLMTNKPVAMAARANRSGTPINSYTYRKEGVRFVLSAQAPPKDAGREGPDVLISFNMSTDVPSATELASGQPASGFATVSQEHNEALELSRPHLMLAAGSPSPAGEAKPFLYVIRYQFDPPEKK